MKKRVKKKRRIVTKKEIALRILIGILIFYFVVGVYQYVKPLPEGVSYEGEIRGFEEGEVEFLYDLTYQKNGEKIYEQEIFDKVFEVVDGAEEFIVLDMFLFNDNYIPKDEEVEITKILKDKLIQKKRGDKEIEIIFVTDPINTFYGSYGSDILDELNDEGIEVVTTDLSKLRDINPVYSSFWRIFIQWFGTSGEGWISNPLNGEEEVTARSFLSLLNVKANHRKLIVTKNEGELVSIITSANPHRASSLHSNVALYLGGDIGEDMLESEKSVVDFSGGDWLRGEIEFGGEEFSDRNYQLLTERKIRKSILKDLSLASEGDELDLGIFYLSDRKIVNGLLDASQRGVEIRIILDPNKDAFAREKNGVPNRPVAYELVEKSKGKIKIRWYDTRGEQFHTKMLVIKKGDDVIVYIGSANYTKRNIGDFNLESVVRVVSPFNSKISIEVLEYFDIIWRNEGAEYTLDFEEYEDDSSFRYWLYRFQEWSGMSSF
jgi:HKD family nuclease